MSKNGTFEITPKKLPFSLSLLKDIKSYKIYLLSLSSEGGGAVSILLFNIIFTAQTRRDQALRHPSKSQNLAIFYHAKIFPNKFTFSVVFTTLKIRIKTPNSEVRLRALNIEGANSLILSCRNRTKYEFYTYLCLNRYK